MLHIVERRANQGGVIFLILIANKVNLEFNNNFLGYGKYFNCSITY